MGSNFFVCTAGELRASAEKRRGCVTLVKGMVWLKDKPGKTKDILTAFGTTQWVVGCRKPLCLEASRLNLGRWKVGIGKSA